MIQCLELQLVIQRRISQFKLKEIIFYIYSIQKQIMFKKRQVKDQLTITFNQSSIDNRQQGNQPNHQAKRNQPITNTQKQQQQHPSLNSQPKKKLKPDFLSNVISSSTTANLQQKQQQLHNEFKSLNYSAGTQLASKQPQTITTKQLLLQEQLAKQKYMQNVNITKDIKQGKLDTGVYRGMNAYANYALTQEEITNAEEKFRQRQGPSRVNSTIRNTCRFDYNFGLCKDWHDSGYCPFGDSCIYLHDRSNYKTGWEQERDFERAQKERWRRINNPDLAQKQDLQQLLKSIEKYKLPETCPKCTKPYKSPVQVQCNHIFCTGCAVSMTKCCICKKTLGGIMNNAQKKMLKMKENYEQQKAKIMKEYQQNKVKRKRFDGVESQDVFAE